MRIALVLFLATTALAQITVKGSVTMKGVTVSGVGGSPPAAVFAQLPQIWANPHSCDPPGGVFDVEKTIPGDYAATWAGLNQAITDWVAAPDQWWRVKITHGTLITGNSSGLLKAKPVGGGLPTKCLKFASDTPVTNAVACAGDGIQDNLAASTQPGIRNPDCNGTGMSYQLGPTVTSVSPGAFVLANGTNKNTSNYNDVAKMYTLESTTVNINGVLHTDVPDVNGNGPSHIVFEDAEIRFTQACCINVLLQNSASTIAGLPSTIGFNHVWVHGDATDAGSGTNAISHNVTMDCGSNCWFVNSQISKSIRPGSEGHAIYWTSASGIMIDHNWIEGTAIGIFDGGIQSQAITGSSGIDIQVTRNRSTYPQAWLGHGTGGGSVCAGQSCARKNALEMKGCNRCLFDGNILENSDDSGGQLGRISGMSVRACSTGICDDYLQTTQNITFSNNILRHGCRGWELDPGSGNSGSGYSAAIPGRNDLYFNDLIYDISLANPGCSTVGSSSSSGLNASGHSFAISSVTRNSAGTITTIQLTGGTGENQTGLVAGDPILLSGCTDTTFNTLTGPPFTLASTVSGTVITYANVGTPNATTTCTLFSARLGWPNFLKINHITSIGGTGLTCMGSTASAPSPLYPRNQFYTDNICAGSGGFGTTASDGTAFTNGWIDKATLVFHHNVIADRVGPTWTANTVYKLGTVVKAPSIARFFRAITSGTSGASAPAFTNSAYSCVTDNTVTWQYEALSIGTSGGLPLYTEYQTIGVATTPPTQTFFPMTDATYAASADSTSIGFTGTINSPSTGTTTCTSGTPTDITWNTAMNLSSWENYALHSSSSFHNAASDGTDIGASIPTIRSSQTATPYVCTSSCGTGPHAN